MSQLSCKQSCKKTAQLKESSHCTGCFSTDGGKILFDCDKSLKTASSSEHNFQTCSFWDMGIKENCSICPLDCKENKNPAVQNSKAAMRNMSAVLDSLSPLMQMSGIDASSIKKAYDVMNSQEINTNTSAEIDNTIKLTNYARDVLNSAMSGKNIDLVEFRKIKEELEKKYKK
jgi:hypothetical protein